MNTMSSALSSRRAAVWRCVLLGCLVLGLAGLAHAASQPAARGVPMAIDAQADIRLTPVADLWPTGGYMAVRVRIENRAAAPRAWNLIFKSQREWREKMEFSQGIAVGAREVVETVVFVPCLGQNAGRNPPQLQVTAEGPGVERHSVGLTSYNSNVVSQIATSASQEVDLYAAITAAASGSGSPSGTGFGGSGGPATELTVVDAAAWPADWRVWSPFTQVVLTDREFRALDGARRAALMDWVALGGVLNLYPPFASAPSEGKAEAKTAWGKGVVRRMALSLRDEKRVPDAAAFASEWQDKLMAKAVHETTPDERKAYELSSGSVGIMLFLLLFGILIGPVNLLVFAPTQKRHRLFITVPLLSIGASIVLGFVIVWRDGFGGEGVQRGVVMLLPGENKAVVFQNQISRTGVLFSRDFTLPADTQLVLPTSTGAGYDEIRESEFFRSGDAVSGDWFASRQRQQHLLQRITTTRARVELTGGGMEGAPVVQSSVGTALRDFYYRDRAGRLWGVDELPPGQKITLRPLPDIWPGLPGGHFVGRASGSELAPLATLDAIRWDEAVFYFTGRLEGLRTP